MSEKLEEKFHEQFGLSDLKEKLGGFSYEYSKAGEDFLKLCFKSLHIIDPRIDRNFRYGNWIDSWEELGSEFEERFFV